MGENKDRTPQTFSENQQLGSVPGTRSMPGKKVDLIHEFGSRKIKAAHHMAFLSNRFLSCVLIKVTHDGGTGSREFKTCSKLHCLLNSSHS